MTKNDERRAIKIAENTKNILGKLLASILGVLIAVTITSIIWTGICVTSYINSHSFKLQSPIAISFQSPLLVREVVRKKSNTAKKTVNTVKKKQPIVKKVDVELKKRKELFEQAYQTVWLHESSKGMNLTGLNGYCIANGQINEIGFDPQHRYCFKDRNEQHETFILWISNRYGANCIKTGYCRETVEELLSLYSNSAYDTLIAQIP